MIEWYRLRNFPLKTHKSVWGLVILSLILSIGLVRADAPHRVGLVVVHGDQVIKKCVEFSEEKLTGYEILERSGLDFNADLSNSLGAAICRIDGQGCTYPAEDCFCQCQGTPCSFWSYWHLEGGAWRFSGLGTSNYEVSDGAVEGWVWGEGTPNRGGSTPPSVTFEEICAPSPTDTPTVTPAPPTDTPTPTDTPAPTDTPTPIPTPVINHFVADRMSLTAGEGVTLSWDLAGAETAYLYYDGIEEGVTAPGSKTLTPATTMVYTLIARNGGGEAKSQVTITVNPAAAAPVAANAAPVTPTVPAAVAPLTSTSIPPANTAPVVAAASPANVSPTEPPSTPATPSTASPTALLLASPTSTPSPPASTPVTQLRPIQLQPHRSAAAEESDDRRDQASRLVVSVGVVILLGLFVAAPVALLGLGWLAWWLRRR